MKSFYPDIYVPNISCITASMLIELSMEAVVLDVDNTLVPHNDPNPTKEVVNFLNDMRKNGIKICIVSNNNKKRVAPFAGKLDIEFFVYDALKPAAYGYLKASELMGVECGKIAAIGDQIFTDVWGAKRAGCYAVLVEPIDIKSENILIKCKRILEKPFSDKIKRGGNI